MTTYFQPNFAPASTGFGFVEAGAGTIAEVMEGWYRRLDGTAASRPCHGFDACLTALQPLRFGGSNRNAVMATQSSWSAIFNNGLPWPDPVSRCLYLTRVLQCRGVIVWASPGHVSRQMLASHRTDFLNYLRVIEVNTSNGAVTFATSGEVQPFEEVEAYKSKRKVDRFTLAMLERYCAALQIRVFDPSFYGPDGFIVERLAERTVAPTLSFSQARAWLAAKGASKPEASRDH